MFDWQDAQLAHPNGRAAGGEPCVVCGQPISPTAHPTQRDRHVCSPRCNTTLKRKFKRRAEREGITPPPRKDPWADRPPRAFATVDDEFPYQFEGLGPRAGDLIERDGSIIEITVVVDGDGNQVPDRLLCVHLNTGAFAVVGMSGSSHALPMIWGTFNSAGERLAGTHSFEHGSSTWCWYQETIRDVADDGAEYTWTAWLCGPSPVERMWTPAYAARSAELRRRSASDARHRRRELLRRATMPGRRIDPVKVFDRDRWVCRLCQQPVEPTLRHPDPQSASLDHRVPLAAGGLHEIENCQTSHLVCNLRKGART